MNTPLAFAIILSVLILVHELGHYLAAIISGVWVEEFGLGLPPRVLGKKIKKTIYSINLLPIGGFVRMHGENKEDGITKPKNAFLKKSRKKRAFITLAGVTMNFLLAIFVFSVIYSLIGIPRETGSVKVVEINEGSPAALAGLQTEDVMISVDGKSVAKTSEFIDYTLTRNNEISLSIMRDGKLVENVLITPRDEYPKSQGPLGIIISSSETYFPPIWQRPFLGAYYGFQEAVFWGVTIAVGIVSIIASLFSGQLPSGVGGPVALYALTDQAAQAGFLVLLNFVGVISVNLALFNLIPFPPLDGGRLLFIILESVLGKRALPKIEYSLQIAGFALLILFLGIVTFREITIIRDVGLGGFTEALLN